MRKSTNCSGEQSLATDTVGCLVQCKIAISTVEQWGRVEEMGGREEGEKKRGSRDRSVEGRDGRLRVWHSPAQVLSVPQRALSPLCLVLRWNF